MKNLFYSSLIIIFIMFSIEVYPQLSITSVNTNYTIDFDNTVNGANNGQYDGSGFSSSPSSGQLHSNAWATSGMSDGNSDFGDDNMSGDFARGTGTGAVGTGGFYAFQVSSSNYAFGIQPGTHDWTPGTLTLRIKNNTGYTLNSIQISYKIYVFNDKDKSNSFDFSYSIDDANYTSVSSLNFSSPETADASPAWNVTSRAHTISSINIPDGGYFYLRWSGDVVPGGSGGMDQFALDDITVNAKPAPTQLFFSKQKDFVHEGDGSYNLGVKISNPSSTSPTAVDVVLVKGDPADIDNYSTQSVNFDAGSSTDKTVNIGITDDSQKEGPDTLIFDLENISGGNLAEAGNPDSLKLIIIDNDVPFVVINEILADPPGGTDGDANGDGHRDSRGYEDEFVELLNDNGTNVDISGWKLYTGGTLRHIFPANTIVSNNESVVVFGGGNPRGIPGIVQTGSEGHLDLTNTGDQVTLKDNNGIIIDSYTYGTEGNDNQSLARDPDITGDFVEHTTIQSNSVLFSPGKSNTDNSELPVQLVSFSGTKQGSRTILKWKTATEVDNYGFDIQRAVVETHGNASLQWTKIGFVKGAGTSNSPHYYSFTDNNFDTHIDQKYRLKQINTDGKFSFSNVVQIKSKTQTQYSLENNYPNPFNPTTTIYFSIPKKSFVILKVYNSLGEKVKTLKDAEMKKGEHKIKFSADGLASGVYYYRLFAKSTNGKKYSSAKEMILLK